MSDIDGNSITRWFLSLRAGDQAAAKKLWDVYFSRMLDLARQRLPNHTAYDGEDAALSAFFVFCKSIEQGQFAGISDRDDLWRCLVRVTIHKTQDRVRHEKAKKRGGKAERVRDGSFELDDLAAVDGDPALAALMADQCRQLLDMLDDEQLEQAALAKLEGLTNEEVAGRLGVSRRTVQRMINVIRRIWEEPISKISDA